MFEASFAPTYETHPPPVTDHAARVKLAKQGLCPDHPDIQLKKRKGIRWKTAKEECPRCAEEFKLKTQCCPVHAGVIMTKTKKFQCGILIHHLVCPLCTNEEIANRQTSKKDLAKKLDLLQTQYAEIASDNRNNCRELESLQLELKTVKENLVSGEEVDTFILDKVLERAIPKMEELLLASERVLPPEPVEHIQSLRYDMMQLETRVMACEGTSQRVVANAMHDVLQQLEAIRNDNSLMAIESEEQRQVLRGELDELQADLAKVKQTMNKLPSQVQRNTEAVKKLLKSYSTLNDELDTKFAEYDSFVASQKDFNRDVDARMISSSQRLDALEAAVASESNSTSARLAEFESALKNIAESTPVVVATTEAVSDVETEQVALLNRRIRALELRLQQQHSASSLQTPSESQPKKADAPQEPEVVVPTVSAEQEFDNDKTRKLLDQKLQNPSRELKVSDSIAVLSLCVEDGIKNATKVSGKAAVVVLGNTGCGKSSLVNYLLGCDMVEKSPRELGVTGLEKLVVVKPVAEGGRRDEVMSIGHTKKSRTFVPQIVGDPACLSVAYCDCPGFLDNRGAEINIANAVNMRGVLKQAKSVKIVILINYHSLLADRGRGLTDMLTICSQLFGNTANISRFQDSLLLGVTQAPLDIDMLSLKEWLLEDTPDIMNVLSKRLFLYDPLDRGNDDFWTRDECRKRIVGLHAIPQTASKTMFQTVLTANDETAMIDIVDKQAKSLRDTLRQGDFHSAGFRWRLLQRLRVIDNISVERMLSVIRLRLQHEVSRRTALFRDYCPHYQFKEAEAQLSSLRDLSRHFPEDDLDLDLKLLSRHYTFFKDKQVAEAEREQRYIDEQKRNEEETTKLLQVIGRQKSEMEDRLSQLLADHSAETSKLRAEMVHQSSLHDEQIAKLHQESASALRQQEQLLALSQALSEEERTKLEEEQNRLMQQYGRRVEEAENEKAIFQAEFEDMLAQQEKTQLESKEALEAYIIALENQREEAERDYVWRQQSLEQHRAAELQNQVTTETAIRASGFGVEEWQKYFRCRVDQDMPLPNHVNEILDGPCPFWQGMTVRDTHLLTFIPANVNGREYTLRALAEISKGVDPPARIEAENIVWERFGNEESQGPYWLLITRGVIPRSLNLLFADQEAMLSQYGYGMPRALETATSIMAHFARTKEKLYATGSGPDGQAVFTRCEEKVAWEGGDYEGYYYKAGDYVSLVGGFDSSSTLRVNSTNFVAEECVASDQGVAGCRRLYSKLSQAYRSGSC